MQLFGYVQSGVVAGLPASGISLQIALAAELFREQQQDEEYTYGFIFTDAVQPCLHLE